MKKSNLKFEFLDTEGQPTQVSEIALSYLYKSTANVFVTNSGSAAEMFRRAFPAGKIALQELFFCMYLNRRNKVLGVHKISEGGTAGTVVDSKLIFPAALICAAHGIIMCHNHPSANTSPSQQDVDLTRKMVAAGKAIDIPILDHIILSPEEGQYLSFADDGLI